MLLNVEEIKTRLSLLKGWSVEENQLIKTFEFKDFPAALRFINLAGDFAEELNHHPDILLFGWNKVKLMISTHDAGGITEKDFQLLSKIESQSL